MEVKDLKKHLVKRGNVDYQVKDGWLCEVARDKRPSGFKIGVGDII